MDRFIRAVRLLSQACGIFAAALTAAAVVIVCQMVFVRYVLNETTIWQTDFVTFSLVAATFIGAPYVLLTKGHVNVDVVPIYVRQRTRWWLALIVDPDLARLRAHHGGADLRVLARGLGEQLALRIDVAGAAVDSLRGDAASASAC